MTDSVCSPSPAKKRQKPEDDPEQETKEDSPAKKSQKPGDDPEKETKEEPPKKKRKRSKPSKSSIERSQLFNVMKAARKAAKLARRTFIQPRINRHIS